jgi:hypothetical protein
MDLLQPVVVVATDVVDDAAATVVVIETFCDVLSKGYGFITSLCCCCC